MMAVTRLVTLMMVGITVTRGEERDEMMGKYERQRYDGWYNNLAHPGW